MARDKKMHVPALNTEGLEGKALCGRQAEYPPDSHEAIRFKALSDDPLGPRNFVRSPSANGDGWCQSCLTELRAEQSLFDLGDQRIRRLRLKPERDRHREFVTRFVKEEYGGLSLEEIAAREDVPIKVVDREDWQAYVQVGTLRRGRVEFGGIHRSNAFGHSQEIALPADLSPHEREFTLAHELAHHFLHANYYAMPKRNREGKMELARYYDRIWEREADEFGRFLIALSRREG